MENTEAALELYLQNWSLVKISQALNVSESTVVRWKKKNNWSDKKQQQAILMKESTDGAWKLLNYQTKALNAKTKEYEEAAKSGKGFKLIDKGDLDAYQKLHSIIKKKDADIVTTIIIIMEFLRFVTAKDLQLSKKITKYTNLFIEEKRR